MFRFNNPDALLVLLLVAAAYAVVRALERGRTAWLVAAATLVGFGFLTKMLQSLLVVPAFAIVYLLAAPTSLRRRIWQLLVAGVALIVASLWWVVVVMMIPASSRPYIGGSTNNSLWNLIFGYNGFGRLTGNETGSVGGAGAAATGRWGPTGLLRMLNSQFGGQISWLLPAAVILGVACLVVTWRAQRTDHTRAAVLLWGGWLGVTTVVFSLGKGIIHPYYAIALAPAIAALVGIGAVAMWARRNRWMARAVLAATVAVTGVWSYVLLDRTPSWQPWLRNLVLIAGLSVAVLTLLWTHLDRRLAAAVAGAALVVSLAGPAAYTLATVATPHTGAIPSAGPAVAGAFGRPGGGFGRPPGATGRAFPGGAPAGGAPGGFARGGPGGGLLNGSTSNAALTAALKQNSGRFTWVAATVGANEASGYQLASGKPVMAIGGFNGTDPSPTLSQFQTYVAQGKVHYFIAGGRGFGGPGGGGANGTASTSSQISSWVQSHYTSQTIGGVTVYDLTKPAT
jgi:4-amino-4-deoxy-L-arabinose transferase-like glycosyltransferase